MATTIRSSHDVIGHVKNDAALEILDGEEAFQWHNANKTNSRKKHLFKNYNAGTVANYGCCISNLVVQ